MTRPTREEVLAALGTDELRGYQILSRIEDRWKEEGRRSRFLFWTYDMIVGFSEIYRVLQPLVKEGVIERLHIEPDRWVYRRIQ